MSVIFYICIIIVPKIIAVSLAFFALIVIFTIYENKILPQTSSFGLAHKRSTTFHRVLQKLLILPILVLINYVPAAIYIPQKSSVISIEDVWKNNFQLDHLSIVVLSMWMSFATKLLGTLAVVSFTRLYVDVGIYAYQLLTYIPTNEYPESKKNSLIEIDNLNNNNEEFEQTPGE